MEPGVTVDLGAGKVAACLERQMVQLAEGARETLAKADISPERVERVIFVGGASLMPDVERVIMPVCANASVQKGAAFTAVIDGLCRAAAH